MEKNKKEKKTGDKKGGEKKGGDKGKKEEKEDKLKTCNFVKARHILCSKQSQIEEIYNKLIEEHGSSPSPSEFAKLATEFSECPSGKKGGNLGYFGRGQMAGEFELAAFSTPPSQMSNIIKTKHGYHIILVEDRKATMK
jgi:NIMA-interacting peptidyl-prolyl cis-trans isomerase 4